MRRRAKKNSGLQHLELVYDTHTYNNLSMPHKNSIRETFTGLLKPANDAKTPIIGNPKMHVPLISGVFLLVVINFSLAHLCSPGRVPSKFPWDRSLIMYSVVMRFKFMHAVKNIITLTDVLILFMCAGQIF